MHFGFGAVRVVGLTGLILNSPRLGGRPLASMSFSSCFPDTSVCKMRKAAVSVPLGGGASDNAAMDAGAPPRLKCMLETLLTADCFVSASRLMGTSRAVFCMQIILYHIRSQ